MHKVFFLGEQTIETFVTSSTVHANIVILHGLREYCRNTSSCYSFLKRPTYWFWLKSRWLQNLSLFPRSTVVCSLWLANEQPRENMSISSQTTISDSFALTVLEETLHSSVTPGAIMSSIFFDLVPSWLDDFMVWRNDLVALAFVTTTVVMRHGHLIRVFAAASLRELIYINNINGNAAI